MTIGYNPYRDTIPAFYLDNVTGTRRSVTVTESYVDPAPTLGSLNPASALAGDPDPVHVRCVGTGFHEGSTVYVDGVYQPTRYLTSTEIEYVVHPAGEAPGTVQVSVTNADGQQSTSRTFTFA
ncbi:MAG TPA: IPT/TIG domain-containing protein [Candidatus Limnocylindrales bacterium]|nr:IPT/TIG domain-containing protein [Candidatus Limnocylindrales bacterium]